VVRAGAPQVSGLRRTGGEEKKSHDGTRSMGNGGQHGAHKEIELSGGKNKGR